MEKLHLLFNKTYYGKATPLISCNLLWKSYVFYFMRLTMEKLRLWFHETYYGKATSLISCNLLWKSYVFDFMRLTMEKLRLWFHVTYYGKATSLISCNLLWKSYVFDLVWVAGFDEVGSLVGIGFVTFICIEFSKVEAVHLWFGSPDEKLQE